MERLSRLDKMLEPLLCKLEKFMGYKTKLRLYGIFSRTALRLEYIFKNSQLREIRLWNLNHAMSANCAGGIRNIFAGQEDFLKDPLFRLLYRNAKGTVWLRQTSRHKNRTNGLALEQFSRLILPTLKEPITLITSNGASDVPEDIDPKLFRAVSNHPMIKIWYTQNLHTDYITEKLRPIPLGLDLHLNRGFGVGREVVDMLLDIRELHSFEWNQRSDRIFVDCHLGKTHPDRDNLELLLENNITFDFLSRRIPQPELWRKYTQSKFILSVRGNGRDCYRTWEALMLGAVPVIVGEDQFGIVEGLPVVKIKNFEELKGLTQKKLSEMNVQNDLDPLEFLGRKWF